MTEDKIQGSTVAIVPAFNPGALLLELLGRLADQVALAVVVDDGSTHRSAVAEAERLPHVHVVTQANRGIAAALNAGFRAALELESDCVAVLTLDQDSLIPPGYVDHASKALVELQRRRLRPAAVCASRFSDHQVRPEGWIGAQPFAFEVAQSGLLITADAWSLLGGFREDLFIDCVDLDFILRAFDRGMPTFLAAGCELEHAAGSIRQPTIRLLFWRHSFRRLRHSSHSAVRNYYIARNRIVVLRGFARKHPKWAARSSVRELRTLGLQLLFDADRVNLLVAACRGVAHGLLGRLGRYSGQ